MYFRTAMIAAILFLVGEAAPNLKRNNRDPCELALLHVEICTELFGDSLCTCLHKHEHEIADIEGILIVCCAP